ncbi:VOC family protein [Caldalkalibacillus salinus]|uniref:VOC family protein n=1 Tax=Caldalkalibacillus salinus TaxID=2803787 RepID=UPI001920AA34|nr:VOC family protein [Caldalkalibacillus salinus]
MSRFRVKQIDTIYLPVSKPAVAADWYVQYLGLEMVLPVHPESDQAHLKLTPEQSLFLIQSTDRHCATFTEANGHEQCVLTLEVENFQACYDYLSRHRVNVSEIINHHECGMNFYVYDLDGNKIDIWSGWPEYQMKPHGMREKVHGNV